MIINWQGLSSFKLRGDKATLIIDPLLRAHYSLNPLAHKADVYLLSTPSFLKYDQNVLEKSAHVFKHPGEYEVKGINIQIDPSLGPQGQRNNIFSIHWKGISIVHLGALKQKASISKALEKINGADILMVPVGRKMVLGANEAVELVHQVEPSIVIPMFYKIEGQKDVFDLDDASYFIQEMGQEKEELEKLKIEKGNINKEKTKLILLKP